MVEHTGPDFEEQLARYPASLEVGGGGTFPLNEQPLFSVGFERENPSAAAGRAAAADRLLVATPDYFTSSASRSSPAARSPRPIRSTLRAVSIINQSAARHFWPNESPIGKRVAGQDGPDTMDDDRRRRRPTCASSSIARRTTRSTCRCVRCRSSNTTWIVHSPLTDRPDAKARSRRLSLAHDPELPVSNFRTLAEVRSSGLESRRVDVALIGLFGLLALVITAAGIAGVVAFSVNQRTQEFGIRMALGAPRTGVLGMVIRQGLQLVTIGLVIGMAGALLLTRLLTTLLFEVEPTDALTYLAVSTVLMMVAVVACLMPARRAASVDPIVALRAL